MMPDSTIGSGATTRDGCSVDLYLRLPYRGEVELMRPWLPAAASVLEFGCAVGRMTRELLAQGYRVTAVDYSPDMLAHVPTEASKVCADIEHLDLSRTFDAVIFASCLINIPDETLRAAQLDKCRAHLRPGGRLLFERHDPTWLSNVTVGYVGITGPIEIFIDEVAAMAMKSHCVAGINRMKNPGCIGSLRAYSTTRQWTTACRMPDLDRRPGSTVDGAWLRRASMLLKLSLDPDASPATLARCPLGAG